MLKEKILFWQGRELLHFGIAKYLEENHPCDLYAIIEIMDKPKKFFEKQKLVNFKKMWYFYDCFTKEKIKPDLSYLASFEKKYKINLWMIAYSERQFLHYNPYHTYTKDEILVMIEQECKFFEKIIDEVKPDFVAMKLSDFHELHLLHQICKAKGVKILMMTGSRLKGKFLISEEAEIFDKGIDTNLEGSSKFETFQEIQNYLKKFDPAKHTNMNVSERSFPKKKIFNFKIIKTGIQLLTSKGKNSDKNRFLGHGKNNFKMITFSILLYLKKQYRIWFLDKNSQKRIKENEKFVFFPLHYEPERTLLITAPFFSNQLEVITSIAKSLPVDYKLYVKEHPTQGSNGWRTVDYYKKLLQLPNVKLIHREMDSRELVKRCELIATVSGTTSLEGAFYQKPSIIFSDIIYSDLPSIFRVKNLDELPKIIRKALKHEVSLESLNNYIWIVEKNAFEVDVKSLRDHSHPFYGALGPYIEIPISVMEEYLEKNKIIFKKWAMEHIKKIKQHKKIM